MAAEAQAVATAFQLRPDRVYAGVAWEGAGRWEMSVDMRSIVLGLIAVLVSSQALAQANQPPVADAGQDVSIIIGDRVFLQGSGTDPDGDPIVSYQWTVDSAPLGSDPIFSSTTVPDPLFIPDLVGDYTLSLVVSDGTDVSLPDTVTILVASNLPLVGTALVTW